MTNATTQHPAPLAVSVTDAAAMLGLTDYATRRLLAEGHIRHQRAGRLIVIPLSALADYLGAQTTRPASATHGVARTSAK